MSATTEFYLAQAQRCTAEADASGLDRVRERNLRAAAAWQAMADKLLHTEKLRAAKDRLTAAAPE